MILNKITLTKIIILLIVIGVILFIYYNFLNIKDYAIFYLSKIFPLEKMQFDFVEYKSDVENYLKENNNEIEASIVFLGDSHTRGLNVKLFLNNSKKILNRGIKGDTTKGILNRLEINVTNIKIDKLFLMIGGNDLKFRDNNEIMSNINLILQKIESPNIYVQSLLPFNEKRKWFNKRIIDLNQKIELFCSKNNLIFINLYPYFINKKNDLPGINPDFTRDGMHLNDKGYNIWIKRIEAFIN